MASKAVRKSKAHEYDARPQTQFEGMISSAVGSIDQREVIDERRLRESTLLAQIGGVLLLDQRRRAALHRLSR